MCTERKRNAVPHCVRGTVFEKHVNGCAILYHDSFSYGMVGVYMNLILLLSITAVALNGVQPSPLISPACARLREQHRGARNTSQLFQKPALNKEYPLAFLHIPKNAGSSVFRVYGRLRIRDDEFHNEVYPDCNNRHVPPRYWQPHNPFDGNKVFCIIRDPVGKAISEFKMRNAGSLNEPGVVSKLQRWLLKKRDWEKGGTDCHMVPQHLYVWDDTGMTCRY